MSQEKTSNMTEERPVRTKRQVDRLGIIPGPTFIIKQLGPGWALQLHNGRTAPPEHPQYSQVSPQHSGTLPLCTYASGDCVRCYLRYVTRQCVSEELLLCHLQENQHVHGTRSDLDQVRESKAGCEHPLRHLAPTWQAHALQIESTQQAHTVSHSPCVRGLCPLAASPASPERHHHGLGAAVVFLGVRFDVHGAAGTPGPGYLSGV